MFYSEVFSAGSLANTKQILIGYNPVYIELALIWFLPSSLLSLFIIPSFIYFYTKKNIKTLTRSLLLFVILIMLFYIIGFILMIFFEMKSTNRYILYPFPLTLEKHIVLWDYLIGNFVFSLIFVPLWHYYLKTYFIIIKDI